MKRGHRLVEGLGHRADRGRAHRTAEQREQDFTDLAGREAQDEAGQDRAVDLDTAPGISLQHLGRAEAPGRGTAISISPNSVRKWRR